MKTKKRSKVKIKYNREAPVYFKAEDNQLYGTHKVRNDVTKKIDYFDGEIQ